MADAVLLEDQVLDAVLLQEPARRQARLAAADDDDRNVGRFARRVRDDKIGVFYDHGAMLSDAGEGASALEGFDSDVRVGQVGGVSGGCISA